MSLNSNELVYLRSIRKKLKILLILDFIDDSDEFDDIIFELAAEYLRVTIDDLGPLPPVTLFEWKINSLCPIFCESFLRFKKPELETLYGLLRFPNSCKFPNKGGRMDGEEVFVRGLYQMATGATANMIAHTF